MGKLTDNYKPTKRAIKKAAAKQAYNSQTMLMKTYLCEKWNCELSAVQCDNCIRIAYQAEVADETGYVSDEELLRLGRHRLKRL